MKHRRLDPALALAMLGSAGIGLTNQAKADTGGTVTITGTVAPVLSLHLSTDHISFGTVDILGTKSGTYNILGVCPLGNGARYISKDYTATVVSSTNFDLKLDSSSSVADLTVLGPYVEVGFQPYGDCDHRGADQLSYILANLGLDGKWLVHHGNPTLGYVATSFLTLAVTTGGLPDGTSLSTQLIYSVEATS